MKNIFKKLGIISFLLIVPGCFWQIPIASQSTEFICNDLSGGDECRSKYDEAALNPVTLSSAMNIVFITVPINACTDLEVDSVKSEDDKVVIDLSEEGMPCEGGSDLVKMELEFDQHISIDYLEVYKENEILFPIE